MSEKDTVYKFPAAYAREHGELEAYRESRKANLACTKAIGDAIRDNYSDNLLDPKGAKDVLKKFGAERTMYVLANTVQQHDWDGRYSQDNKRWANTIPIQKDIDPWGDDRNSELCVTAHPCLVDGFISQAREAAELEKKPSVREKLSTSHQEQKPKISAPKNKGQER